MGRLEEKPVPDQSPSFDQPTFNEPQGRAYGYPVPQSPTPAPAPAPAEPPPQGYPNLHDNPLSPPPPIDQSSMPKQLYSQPPPAPYPPPPAAYPQPHAAYPQPPAAYPQSPAAYPQPPAAYPQSPAAYPQPAAAAYPVVANGSCGPQMYSYTPNHNCQPQVGAGTPNWYQPGQPAISIQEWSTGLLDCFDDPENAIMTLCFPCVTFGQIAEILDNGQTSCATSGLIYSLITAFIGIPCIMSCSYRTKIRSRYNLVETPAPDWVTHFLCEYCALCQEYRELKNRGMDPALGWQGNLSKHQQMTTMAPPINQRMMMG